VLRVYVGCATALYGELEHADLVKIHIQSGKVSLMKFDDFAGSPMPRLRERVKIRMRDQDLDYFQYGGDFVSPYLYFKSRSINEEFEGYADQLEFDRQLEALGLEVSDDHGPRPEQ